MLFNSDNEALTLLIISDFSRFDIQSVSLNMVEHPLWHQMYERYGANNSLLCLKINTFLTSFEFLIFLQLIIDGRIDSDDPTEATPINAKVEAIEASRGFYEMANAQAKR